MDIGPILELLNRERGLSLGGGYYTHIQEWEAWWKGYYQPFHRFFERQADGKRAERQLYSLGMAKKVCEDWASLLLNERTALAVGDKASSIFLQGEDGSGGVLGENQFWLQANALVEKAFYSGTGAVVVHLDGMREAAGGALLPGPSPGLHLDYLPASCIVPLSVRQGQVTECAFCSEVLEAGRPGLYLELHTLSPAGYVVENRFFDCRGGAPAEAPLPPGLAPRVETRSAVPLFAILRPNQVNTIEGANGLGAAVFAGAIDNLKGADLAYNNFCRDFKLGGKKVFYSQDLLQRAGDGGWLAPDDICQQLFYAVGDRTPDDTLLIQEHNPDLRVTDNAAGVQAMLDYLSFKCGLGAKRYRFDAGTVVTATQYLGDQQELAQHLHKHFIAVGQMVGGVVRALLWAGREVLGLPVDPAAKFTLQFDDSVIVDKETERLRDKEDVRDGIMHKWEFRVKWYGEDEATAKRLAPDDGLGDDGVMGFADA